MRVSLCHSQSEEFVLADHLIINRPDQLHQDTFWNFYVRNASSNFNETQSRVSFKRFRDHCTSRIWRVSTNIIFKEELLGLSSPSSEVPPLLSFACLNVYFCCFVSCSFINQLSRFLQWKCLSNRVCFERPWTVFIKYVVDSLKNIYLSFIPVKEYIPDLYNTFSCTTRF